ncbi:MAG: undecaprenyl-diphosphate phosphatase [Pseudomonadota bacterium]
MALLDIIALALIQGITEFLPISSSGHLVLYPLLTGRPDQGVRMDVAVHFGTLIAVCLYFRAETAGLFRGGVDILLRRWATPEARLAFLVGVASVPAVAAGFALKATGGDLALRSVEVIGWATLLGGLLLWAADAWGRQDRRAATPGPEDGPSDAGGWTLRDAVLMGLAQALALVPGTSRSGITMTAARALGFERAEAARISLVMAIPLILAASAVETVGLMDGAALTRAAADGSLIVESRLEVAIDIAIGAALACLAALAALWAMFRMFRGAWTMLPFVLYRLALGGGLLILAYA